MAKVIPSDALEKALRSFHPPSPNSHKGQNGKLLIIGGSSLFHAAVLWSAEVASHFVDLVHFCSTEENNQIFINLKTKFRNGIVIQQKDLENYVEEDDCILVGPGMLREDGEEARFTHDLTKRLIEKFPHKRFVFDAGAMQLMKPEWLTKLQQPAIVTPHQKEFAMLFGEKIDTATVAEKRTAAQTMAKKYHCVVLLKAVVDIVSDGLQTITIEGGNAGLTKGGTGDVLAALAAAFFTKNDGLASCLLASFFLKKTAETLSESLGLWFNTSELISQIPHTVKQSI